MKSAGPGPCERTKRLIDGHARKELFAGKGKVPVLIGSWDEATEKKILATLDPLGAMAEINGEMLAKIFEGVTADSDQFQSLLNELACCSQRGENDIQGEWADQGMPEFENPPIGYGQIIVHFKTKEDRDKFAQLVNQKFTEKTKAIWWP